MTEKSSPSKSAGDGEFRKWLWDGDAKAFMGRTGSSWVKLLTFYTIFYLCLALFWTACLQVFYQTLDWHVPKWQLDGSRIGVHPGMGFRPRPPDSKIESTLIWFTSGKHGNYKHWVDSLDDYVKPYKKSTEASIGAGEAITSCGAGPAEKGKFCPFIYKEAFKDVATNCTADDQYGYDKGQPCVLVKINKIFGWVPKPWAEYPAQAKYKGPAGGILIQCEGENPADKENIGPISYTPNQQIRVDHYPYTNQPGYLAPFVFVQFLQPSRGVLINVECKAWAENIKYSRQEREGSVHFELLVD